MLCTLTLTKQGKKLGTSNKFNGHHYPKDPFLHIFISGSATITYYYTIYAYTYVSITTSRCITGLQKFWFHASARTTFLSYVDHLKTQSNIILTFFQIFSTNFFTLGRFHTYPAIKEFLPLSRVKIALLFMSHDLFDEVYSQIKKNPNIQIRISIV